MTVTVYTMPNCYPCEATKRRLEQRGIAYTVESLAKSETGLALAAAHRITAAPLVAAGGKVWGGFRPDLIDEILPE